MNQVFMQQRDSVLGLLQGMGFRINEDVKEDVERLLTSVIHEQDIIADADTAASLKDEDIDEEDEE